MGMSKLDPRRQGELLVDVLELAEALPYRPRPLIRPDWSKVVARLSSDPTVGVTRFSDDPRVVRLRHGGAVR